jgi:drug/metabolite transporter (DMT)-like permease
LASGAWLLALLATLPLHLLFLRFLWRQKPCPGGVLLLLAPLCLVVPLAYTPYAETQYLAVSGPVMAVLQHLNTRHKRQEGMRMI